jgi:hypothetical protein
MLVSAVLLLLVDVVASTSSPGVLALFVAIGLLAGSVSLRARLVLARIWK